MEHGATVKSPVLLCDNTWLARNVVLDGDVIVSTGSFIGEGTRLRRTFVGRDTYLGTGLDFENKIIIGNRVIDAATGAFMDIEEPGLARRIPPGFGWLRSLWHFLCGRSHGRRG
jgi:NDP-sugar pyrophosphorylase family protein